MLSRLCCGVALVSLGCSSSDFKVSGDDVGSVEDSSSTTVDTALGDSAVVTDDTPPEVAPPGPCDPEMEKTKFCIDIKAAEHPAYDGPAPELGINGKGKLFVLLFDKDPGIAGAKIVKTITHPPDTIEMEDNDFPVTLKGELPGPGPYSVVAYFADSTKMRGDGRDRILAGDLAIAPKLTGTVSSYPKLAFERGKVEKSALELKPVRQVKLVINSKPGLKDLSSTVRGDGPVLFGLTDATTISEPVTWLHYDQGGCVNLQVQSVPAPALAYFPVIGEGTHNVFVGVVDYGTTKIGWPGQGTLITPLANSGAGMIPKLVITPTSWVASANVEVITVAHSATDGTGDLTCP